MESYFSPTKPRTITQLNMHCNELDLRRVKYCKYTKNDTLHLYALHLKLAIPEEWNGVAGMLLFVSLFLLPQL